MNKPTSDDESLTVFVADMDGDGDLDIVSPTAVSLNDDTIDIGMRTTACALLDDGSIMSTPMLTVNSVFVADMDGDGDLDIVSASVEDGHHCMVDIGVGEHSVCALLDNGCEMLGAIPMPTVNSVYVADMDGNGDFSTSSRHPTGRTIAWYENDGAANSITGALRYGNVSDGGNHGDNST